MAYTVKLKSSATRELAALAADDRQRVWDAIVAHGEDPRPSNQCKKLRGEASTYRVRVGKYRVVYEIRDSEMIVLVVRVANRDQVYSRRR